MGTYPIERARAVARKGQGRFTVGGRAYVVLEESEYERMRAAHLDGHVTEPLLPQPSAKGNYPASETLQVLIARKILRRRRAARLSQAELAKRAGIRLETLNRLETGKHAPTVRTVDRIDQALRKAGV